MPTARRPAPARSRRPARPPAGSRERLLAAAAADFAARGFSGASVDRIARQARVNKAMIYYHFHSKAALYQEILRDMFEAVARRVGDVARDTADPADKIRGFVAAIATEAEARPHFPPIWFREIADAGRHLDARTTAEMARIIAALGGIIGEGVASRRFRPIPALLVHAGIVAPLLLYFASGDLRRRLERRGAHHIQRREIISHVQRIALATLEAPA